MTEDIVIVVDVSGSMGTGDRVKMAQDATKKVIDTFSWTDYATVVTFGSAATARGSLQVRNPRLILTSSS